MPLTITPADAAYAAGLFEGEGSTFVHQRFGVDRQPVRVERKLVIAMCDREPLDEFTRIVGVGKVRGPYTKNDGRTKPMYQYGITKFEEVQHVIAVLWPRLGPRRREQCLRTLKLEVLRAAG